jgi:hypothetical protein
MPENVLIWLAENTELLMLAWGSVLAFAEVLKRAIPGTKDDTRIVQILDTVGKIFTFGAATFLPKQAGKVKPPVEVGKPPVEVGKPPVEADKSPAE